MAKQGDKELLRGLEILKELKTFIEQGNNVRGFSVTPEDKEKHLDDLFLLTFKPVIYASCNEMTKV
jgi:ribosome-binding ATPase YchF (GTP1/OBG family)